MGGKGGWEGQRDRGREGGRGVGSHAFSACILRYVTSHPPSSSTLK